MSHSRLPLIQERLEVFTLYETKSKLYLVGSPLSGAYYRILKIDRLQPDPFAPNSHAISEDSLSYDKNELRELLHMINQGNAANGGLKEIVSNCCGVIGFVKFLQGQTQHPRSDATAAGTEIHLFPLFSLSPFPQATTWFSR